MILEINSFSDLANYGTPSDISSIITHGYYAFGDGGAARYKRVDVTPSHKGYGVSATGGIFEICEKNPNVRMFGAVGDGVTDDTVAFNAATFFLKPASSSAPVTSAILDVPEGTYLLSSPVSLYSGTILQGVGIGSIIKSTANFLGTALFSLWNTYPEQYKFGGTSSISFDTSLTPSVWALASANGFVLQCKFYNLIFNGGYGLNLASGYTQSCIIDTLYSSGNLEQFITIYGNRNWMFNFDKEGATGTSADPYILIKGSSNCVLDNILLEGTCSSNKVGVLITDNGIVGAGNRKSSVWMRNCWFEMTGFVGNTISIENGSVLHIDGNFTYLFALNQLINVAGGSTLHMALADTSGTDSNWNENIILDATSKFIVASYIGRHLEDTYPLIGIDNKVIMHHAATAGTVLPVGVVNNVSNANIGANLLVNPSFEAGFYGWTINSSVGTTLTYPSSDTARGKMLDAIVVPTASRSFTQNVVILAGMVGQPITFSAVVNLISGDVNAFVGVYANGAGINTYGDLSKATIGSGWQLVTQTFVPQVAGTMAIGLYCLTVGHVQIDECFCGFGTVGLRNPSAAQSLDLGAITLITAVAAPVTGTWKVGDRVFNSTPSVGNPKSWVCTVAGSPGTWVSEGNL